MSRKSQDHNSDKWDKNSITETRPGKKAERIFDELNAKYFKGKLKPIPILLAQKQEYKALIFYRPYPHILLSKHFLKTSTEEEIRQIILHEMIHYFLYFFNISDSSSVLIGHSDRFKRIAKRLGITIFK